MDRFPKDSRQRYTKECLYESFLHFLAEKPVSDITVIEVCDYAGISRKTFYKYYSDPFALLLAMQDDLFLEYRDQLDEAPPNVYEMTPVLIRFADEHRVLLRAVFANRGKGNFIDRMIDDLFATYGKDWQRANPTMPPGRVEALFYFVVSGMVGVVRRWLFNHPDMDVDEVIAEGAELMVLADPNVRDDTGGTGAPATGRGSAVVPGAV